MPERPDDLVVLTSASSEMQAALFVNVLSAHGIDAVGPNAAATTLRWEVSSTDPYRVYVRREDVERARQALSQERSDSVDIDWDSVNTGAPDPGGTPSPETRGDGRLNAFWTAIGLFLLAMLVLGLFMAVR